VKRLGSWQTILGVVTALVVGLLPVSSVRAATRADQWEAVAVDAITAFEAADQGGEEAHAYAYMAGAIARLYGWSDPRVQVYLDKVYALRKPDGGWGLNGAYDKFNDGTVNPATTTYTVTITDHVGLVLLDAYEQGLVPAADIATLVSLTMSTQTWTFSNGQCTAYSRSSNDAISGTAPANQRCVHNVNALAAWWLRKANAAGFVASGLNVRVQNITRHEVANYLVATTWWPYRGTLQPNDSDHNSADAEAMYDLANPIGREVAYQMLTHTYTDNAMAPMAHLRLVGLPPAPGSMSGATTLWCVLGDGWLTEVTLFVANAPTTRSLAQAAYWASRNAKVC